MTYWTLPADEKGTARRHLIKCMCIHTALSLPLYRHILLTLKFQCGLFHICIISWQNHYSSFWLKDPVLSSSENHAIAFYMWPQSFAPAEHFSLPYTVPHEAEKSHWKRRGPIIHFLDQGLALNSVCITGKFGVSLQTWKTVMFKCTVFILNLPRAK